MLAPQSGSPMTNMPHDKQYIVLSISGDAYSGEVLAFFCFIAVSLVDIFQKGS